ncbi:hypothetical protein [Humibacillus xanthopallidus]|uniref:hypothetical protein n=1 Tax=Humibacillus xanthopallidus TaxID=412689 RepID=UPI00384B2D95
MPPIPTPGSTDETEPAGVVAQQPGLAGSSELQARVVAAARASGRPLLDAGRGQPNWTATLPRAGFFRLGAFAVEESGRLSSHDRWGELPPPEGLHGRLVQTLIADGSEGAAFLADALAYAVSELGFEADAFVHELVRAVLGAGYPADPDADPSRAGARALPRAGNRGA